MRFNHDIIFRAKQTNKHLSQSIRDTKDKNQCANNHEQQYSNSTIAPAFTALSGLRALERKPIEPLRLRLRLITIEINKVVRPPIKLNHPVSDVQVHKRALCAIRELDQLRRATHDSILGINRSFVEELGDLAWDAVGGDAGCCVGPSLVVEDADGDLRGGGS